VLIFVVPWVVYALLLGLQRADRFDAWHNEVVWPAAHFMTDAQEGLVGPAFGHVMFGGLGGLVVATVLIAIGRGLCKRLGRGDPATTVLRVTMLLASLWSFTTFKAVPVTVTEIDPAGHSLTVRRFGTLLRVPAGTTRISGGELVALELGTYTEDRSDTRYLRIYAWTREGAVRLADRVCEDFAEQPCLQSGDADLVELAGWLGHEVTAIEAREGRHLLRMTAGP